MRHLPAPFQGKVYFPRRVTKAMGTSFRFGEFELHPDRFELRRAGHGLRLERKPLELLTLLVLGGGRVVTRTEISEHLWGRDVFVDAEHGINTAVRKLRQALRDDPERPRFIQTVPRLGYRFLAPVSAHKEQPSLPAPAPPVTTARTPGFAIPKRPWFRLLAGLGLATGLLVAVDASIEYRHPAPAPEVRYEQLTDLTDAAVAPAISPDGRTVAFIRGDSGFASSGRVYVKALPNGENRRVSDDERPKYGLAFSPDGSQIAYTVFGANAFATYAVSIFGGAPHLVLSNAAGLSWLNADQLLFSKIRSGINLGVVTGPLSDGSTRDVYFPTHTRAMAHYSEASPDRHWVLVVEMDSTGSWAPCRVVGFSGSPGARVVGPTGACTAAAWSPDGKWMYFIASIAGQSHIWRQRFPYGSPQQITFGAAEEDGLAVERNGTSLITSIGTAQSALWVHDNKGERALSSEGEVLTGNSSPLFRHDDQLLYYLLRRRAGQTGAELWRAEPSTGKLEAVFPRVAILDYDVSADGEQLVFTTETATGTELWLAPTDRSRLPVRLDVKDASYPHFGAGGKILFQFAEGNANYLEQTALDGHKRSRLVPFPIEEFQGVSPGGRWAMAVVAESPRSTHPTLVAIPLDGSPPRRICAGYCVPRWSSSGRFLFVPVEASSNGNAGRSLLFPVGPNERLPELPPAGITVLPAPDDVPGAKAIPLADLVPGKDPAHYAFVRTSVQRNLFRVSLK